MCRLLIGSSNALRVYHRLNNLNTLLSHLERECGGQGNGVAMHRGGALIETHKGVDLPVKDIAHTLVHCSKIYDVAIFHTRVASVSSVSDSNCHPYISGNDALAMNGTLYEFRDVARALGITDTEVAFNLVRGLSLEKTIIALSTLDAVFVGMAEGKPYALRNGGALKEWRPKRMAASDFLFASSFPRGVNCVEDLPSRFTFADGKRGKTKDSSPNLGYSFRSWASYESWPPSHSNNQHYYYEDTKVQSSLRSISSIEDAYEQGYDDGYAAGFEDGFREVTAEHPYK